MALKLGVSVAAAVVIAATRNAQTTNCALHQMMMNATRSGNRYY